MKFGLFQKLKTIRYTLSAIRSQAAFTLVELLVVIGILGILATGLLATIDPLEQLNRGTDSNSKSSAIELINGMTRYYANHQALPWDIPTAQGPCPIPYTGNNQGDTTGMSVTGRKIALNDACILKLITDGELKASFNGSSTAIGLYYNVDPAGVITKGKSRPVVCYKPLSKAERNSNQAIYSPGGKLLITDELAVLANRHWCGK